MTKEEKIRSLEAERELSLKISKELADIGNAYLKKIDEWAEGKKGVLIKDLPKPLFVITKVIDLSTELWQHAPKLEKRLKRLGKVKG